MLTLVLRRFLTFLLIGLTAAFAPSGIARADALDALLEIDAPLSSHDPAEQKLALQSALRLVLMRFSGHGDLGSSPGLMRALELPHRYTTRMAFVATPKGEVLRIGFNRAAVESLLKTAGRSVWMAHRPTLVLWLVSDGPRHGLLGRNSSDPLLVALHEQAKARGLPLAIATGDAGEASLAAGIDAKAFAPLVTASQRYGSQMALAGRVHASGAGGVSGQWALIDPYGAQNVALQSATPLEQAAAVIDWAIRRLLADADPHIATAAPQNFQVRVTGINNFADYAGAITALKGLKLIKEVDVTVFVDDTLSLRVVSPAPFPSFARALAAAPGMTVVLDDVAANADGSDASEQDGPQAVHLAWTGTAAHSGTR